ncbi:hypothetical protein B0H17DRAFT_1120943 [Mycena rosella]|uniref:DDE-1 domain-containing protein n=1 Tax=Mycena rosella TaxID=1033263 RepID=A0AAD7AYS9_MYCRO|nr:hypothetical protein B0H17DRAFT_1120943 [Mycena rosella]
MAMYSDDASNIPELADISDSDDSDISVPASAGPSRTQAAQAQPAVPAPPAGPKAKITSYWKVETAEEKAVRLERSARVYSEGSEERQAREVDKTCKKKARERVEATERMPQYRDRRRDAKIAAGEIPSLKRKHAHLLEHDDTPGPSPELPELSRPHHQFKESSKKKNKPSGRKQKLKNQKRDAKYTNWSHPLLWSQIETAARLSGKPWSQRAIMKALHRANLKTFHRLSEQVIGTWIDPEAKKRGVSKWKDSILKNVELRAGNAPGGQTTRCGVLHPYPETRKKIHNHLTSLRGAGVALTLLTIRALMISHIEEDAPELFHHARADGSTFRCSESFVRRYLRNTLGWSERRATKAAQKLPANHEKVLEEAFFREAHVIRDYAVPAALRVNTDQTQLVYQQGSGSIWNQRGAKQVATVGQEEKRAFTLVPSISASGVLLPMQAVFNGRTMVSCPSPSSARMVIAPYFERVKKELGLPESQMSIWKIDCWSVHKSKEFMAWMKLHHPRIIVIFVPGGCTGLWQPLDVGIQRLLKLSIKRSAHRDLVNEALVQIKAGKPPHEIKLDTTVGTLRNRSVGWIVQAIHDLSDPATITQVRICPLGLRNLRTTHPTLHAALTGPDDDVSIISPEPETEEEPFFDSNIYDDCDVPLDVVSQVLLSGGSSIAANFTADVSGGITRSGNASDAEPEESADTPAVLGRGQRKKIVAKRYQGPIWEQHR